MDRQAFRNRMQQLKQYREQNPGKTYLDWKNSLPSNLQDESNYNLHRAYELGYEPEWNEDDKSYHLPTRDSETGEILKKPWHPTFLIGLQEDAKLGYYPQIKNGTMYTTTWEGNENPIYKYADGGEIPPNNKPIIPEQPQLYKGKLYKDRYGRKYTESQLDDYYDNSTDEIDRFTGKPFVRGLKPVGDIEDAANVTPVGDAISIYDAYSSAKNKDWLGTGLALFSVLPFVPSSVNKVKRAVPTVNKNLTNDLLNKQFEQESKELALRTKTVNEVYNTVERLMDDPAYIRRAEQVREQFGTDYTVPYADAFIAYNLDPSDLPHVKTLDDQLSASKARMMTKHNKNSFTYGISKLDHSIPNVTEHEMSHYIDMLQTGDYLNAEAGNNMFYQMSKDLDKKVDSRDKYFSNPSEQKAHMNQLREYMFQNGMIDSRGDTVSDKMMKNVLNKIKGIDGMQGIFRASEQFKSIKTYTKWFNSIPLLGVGAAAVYSNNQE